MRLLVLTAGKSILSAVRRNARSAIPKNFDGAEDCWDSWDQLPHDSRAMARTGPCSARPGSARATLMRTIAGWTCRTTAKYVCPTNVVDRDQS